MTFDITTINQIIQYINIGCIVLLVLACLRGFIAGFAKSWMGAVTLIVPIALLLIFLDLITNSLLDINLSFLGGSVRNYLQSQIYSLIDVPTEELSSIPQLVDALTLAIGRMMVFYVGLSICMVIIRPILNLIAGAIRRSITGKKKSKWFLGRILAMPIYAIRLVFVISLFVMPLLGITSMVGKLQNEVEALSAISETDDHYMQVSENDSTEIVFEACTALNDLYIKKMYNAVTNKDGVSIDEQYVGYLIRIKRGDETLNIAKEIKYIIDAYGIYEKYIANQESVNWIQILKNEKAFATDFLANSDIIPMFGSAVLEYVSFQEEFKASVAEYGVDVAKIRDIDWSQTMTDLSAIVGDGIDIAAYVDEKVAGGFSGDLISIFNVSEDTEQNLSTLFNQEMLTYVSVDGMKVQKIDVLLSNFIKKLLEFGIVKDFMLPIIQTKLDEVLAGNPELATFKGIIELDSINYEKDILIIASAVRAFNIIYKDGALVTTFGDAEINAIQRLITLPFNISFINGKENVIMTKLLSLTGLDNNDSINLDFSIISDEEWDKEPYYLANILSEYVETFGSLSLDFNNLLDEEKVNDPEYVEDIEDLLKAIVDSKLILNTLPTLFNSVFTSGNLAEWEGEWLKNQIDEIDPETGNVTREGVVASREDWHSEVENLVDVIVNASSLVDQLQSLDLTTLTEEQLTKLKTLVLAMNNTKTFKLDPLADYLDTAIQSIGISGHSVASPSDKEAWDAEINNLFAFLDQLNDMGLLSNSDISSALKEQNSDDITSLLGYVNNSNMLRGMLPKVINTAITSVSMENWLNPWLTNQADGTSELASKEEWDVEIAKLAAIISEAATTSMDTASLDIKNASTMANVESILLKMNASKTFTLNPLVDLIQSAVNDLGISGASVQTPSDFEWEAEITNLFDLFEKLNSLSLLSSTDVSSSLQTQTPSDIVSLLNYVNNSSMIRMMLPKLLSDAIGSLSMSDWQSTWLSEQVTTPTAMASKAEWETEINALANIISEASTTSMDASTLDLKNSTALTSIKGLLLKMNDAKTFKLDPLADLIQDSITATGIGVDIASNPKPANSAEWVTEINALFAIIEYLQDIDNLDNSALKGNNNVGLLLNSLHDSMIISGTNGATYNAIINNVIGKSEFFSGGSAVASVVEPTGGWYAANINWVTEIDLLASINVGDGARSGDVLDKIAQSVVLKPILISQIQKNVDEAVDALKDINPLFTPTDDIVVNETMIAGITSWTDEIIALNGFIAGVQAGDYPTAKSSADDSVLATNIINSIPALDALM